MMKKQKTTLRKEFSTCLRNEATPVHLVTESENLEVENQVEVSVAPENSQMLPVPFAILLSCWFCTPLPLLLKGQIG